MRCITRGIAGTVLGLSVIAPVGGAVAEPVSHGRQEIVRVVTNLCNGARLELHGTFHFVLRRNQDGTQTSITQVHARGASAGTVYVWNQVRESIFDETGGFELKGTDHTMLVSKGSGPNQVARFHFDFTASPPIRSFEVKCVG